MSGIATRHGDDVLVRELCSAPPLVDAVESLEFWRARERGLPLHRRAARREARDAVLRAERQLSSAILAPTAASPHARLRAARLLAASRGRRVTRRWAFRLCAVGAGGAAAAGAGFGAVVSVLGG